MSDVSCNGTPHFADDRYLDSHSSTESESSADTPVMENTSSPDVIIIAATTDDTTTVFEDLDGGAEQADAANNDEPTPYTKRKRKKTSEVWDHFRVLNVVGKEDMMECIHCGEKMKKLKDGTTTTYRRHFMLDCPVLKSKAAGKGQLNLKMFPGKSDAYPTVRNWKFDNARMREFISHMIMVHELPFNFVEYELFNVVMKEVNPAFNKISRAATKEDCISSYDIGKRRVQKLLNTVKRVSITIDMWTSGQNIHYMVVTCHFVDFDFKLHKIILSFVAVPPPYTRVCIYDSLFKCLKEWNIETKVATLTVDNAKTNDVVARSALEFKEVFVNYADRELTYTTLPSEEDWKKVEDVCSFLALFEETTKIISGSEYPTSNLFLSELFGIKEALDAVALDGCDHMKEMAIKMKKKFDKYWGTCNLLISIGAVMDPRYKMKLIEFSFKGIYSDKETALQIQMVKDTLYLLFEEYVDAHKSSVVSSSSSTTNNSASKSDFPSLIRRQGKCIKTGTAKYDQHIRSVDSFNALKSKLDTYLEEGVYIGEQGVYFDALGWWKENNLKFRILSKMAADILAIPVTTVASESAFSAGGRVIDPHRSSLGTETVYKLICGADWYRRYYGLEKKKNNVLFYFLLILGIWFLTKYLITFCFLGMP
ncbi:hypothetical protein LXL04_028106 [Taraxacum kok-saghyz]